jgi:antitoxin (DNA-binding transcriptional repressor) of toxin-antitoxin stability system
MHEAKTQLSRLVQELRDGHEREFIIAVSGKPCARLVPYEAPKKRVLGIDRGVITIAADFDEPNAELEELFYNSPIFPEDK